MTKPNQFLTRICDARRHQSQRGQMLIIFALLIVPVSLALAAVAIDASLWQSERRGAQKDADLAALAGAYALLNPTPSTSDAKTAAAQYQQTNDDAGNAGIIGSIDVDASCFAGGTRPDSVKINVSHSSRALFSSIFGLKVAPDIGAHARACAGSVISTTGLRPYGIESNPGTNSCGPSAQVSPDLRPGASYASLNLAPKTNTPTAIVTPSATPTVTRTRTPTATSTPSGPTATPTSTATPPSGCDIACFQYDSSLGYYVPKFGAWCRLDDGSQDPSTSQRGLLDLAGSGGTCAGQGSSSLPDNIRNGSNATCNIGDTVPPIPGGRPGQDLNQGLQPLLAGQGTPPVADGAECDKKYHDPAGHDGIDDFDEVVERIDGGSIPSPDGPYTNNGDAHAAYQLRDCTSPRVIDLIVIGNLQTDPTIKAFAAFYILGCKMPNDPLSVLPNTCNSGAPGQLEMWGIFFNRVELGGDVGEFNPFGDNKIALTE